MTDEPYVHHVGIRYLEVDQQGVVFNMWYLAYLDDAMTGFLHHHGLAYQSMTDAGFDAQLVHTELDWTGSLGWGSDANVVVQLDRVGRSSFTLAFDVRDGEQVVATAKTVYVCVRTDGSGSCEIPPLVLEGLGATPD